MPKRIAFTDRELDVMAVLWDRGSGTVAEVRERLRRLTMNPVAAMLELRDSLLLSDEQIGRLEAHRATFDTRADAALAPVVEYVIAKGRKAKDREVAKRIGKVQQKILPLMIETLRQAAGELREEQRARLPSHLRALL